MILLLFFAYLINVVVCDLPIHCLTSHVSGKWTFSVGPQSHDHTYTCGYSTPDKNELHFRPPQSNYRFEQTKTIEFDLVSPNIVKDSNGASVGTWTMIYDEGFEVRANNQVFFAFNNYKPKAGSSTTSDEVRDYISMCHETMIGWYHGWEGDDADKWGCWQGKKTHDEFGEGGASLIENPGASDVHRALHTRTKARTIGGAPVSRRNTPVKPYDVIVSKKDFAADAESKFEPSAEFVETVNNNAASTWQAKIHDDFKQYTLKDMMRMIGWRQYHKPTSEPRSIPSARSHQRQPLSTSSGEDLPESWDWRDRDGKNYVTPVRNQNSCGSCYSIAATAVAESRLLIQDQSLSVDNFKLSPQSVVSCSTYNQGCDGGYPFLVGKHGRDFGLVPETCMPYTGTDGACSSECGATSRYFLEDYGYIGGYYGGCSEQAMMEEIHQNGPIIVAFNAPGSLFYYMGGIFHCGATETTESENQAPDCHDVHKWEKTNHAVVAVGWGVDAATGKKYWIIKNSWGSNWGENGYFRITRGEDDCAIESMGVHVNTNPVKRTVSNPNPTPASSLAEVHSFL